MSETPTAPASERALARARARGDVPFTQDWTLAAGLLGALAALAYAGPVVVSGLQTALRQALVADPSTRSTLIALAAPSCALLIAPWLAVQLARVAQRGFSSRLSGGEHGTAGEWQGAKPSRRVPILLGYARAAVLAWALIDALRGSLPGLALAWQRSTAELLSLAAHVGRALVLRAAVVLLVLGALDLTVQQLLRLRRLRMTRRQVLEEQRELAGDPHWVAERRKHARALAASHLPLSAATIVITGEGCAAALRFVPGQQQAPVLCAKAQGVAAVELVRGAYAFGVPLASEPSLASALCRIEPSRVVPDAMHAGIARLLARAGRVPA